MSERTQLLDLLDRAYTEKAWHGPSVMESLAGISASVAAKHPMRGVRSIWELVEHIASWDEIVATRLEGAPPQAIPMEYNFPPVTKTTPAAWKATLRRLARTHARFRRAVVKFPIEKLGRRRPKMNYTWGVLIHGQIQHELYHAGQITLLRRALGKPVA